jgi:hypothetical protein
MVSNRRNVVGVDTTIIAHPQTWVASGLNVGENLQRPGNLTLCLRLTLARPQIRHHLHT